MVRIGSRRIWISLQAPIVSRDAMGTPVTSYLTVATVPAKETAMRSDEAIVAMAQTGYVIRNFNIRYRSDVNAKWRVLKDGKQMAVIAPPIDINGMRRELDIKVKDSI